MIFFIIILLVVKWTKPSPPCKSECRQQFAICRGLISCIKRGIDNGVIKPVLAKTLAKSEASLADKGVAAEKVRVHWVLLVCPG